MVVFAPLHPESIDVVFVDVGAGHIQLEPDFHTRSMVDELLERSHLVVGWTVGLDFEEDSDTCPVLQPEIPILEAS